MGEFGMERVRSTLAWDYSEPPLLAAYDKAMTLATSRSAAPQPAPARLRPPRR
jgi:hypothetical protein